MMKQCELSHQMQDLSDVNTPSVGNDVKLKTFDVNHVQTASASLGEGDAGGGRETFSQTLLMS